MNEGGPVSPESLEVEMLATFMTSKEWSVMMESVFIVQHLREDEEGYDNVKLIGVYSSRERAAAAVESHKGLPGFSDYIEGFSIEEYEIDKDHWNEGFVDLSRDGP